MVSGEGIVYDVKRSGSAIKALLYLADGGVVVDTYIYIYICVCMYIISSIGWIIYMYM